MCRGCKALSLTHSSIRHMFNDLRVDAIRQDLYGYGSGARARLMMRAMISLGGSVVRTVESFPTV
eukprot:2417021-Amphidinium_carterae.1